MLGLLKRWFLALTVAALAGFAAAEKRVALVIGNSAYESTPKLVNPPNDANDIATVLERLGFQVLKGNDLDKRGMDRMVTTFARAATDADVALFFYAGHGMQFQGSNYLMPIDAKLEDEVSLPFEMTRLDDVLGSVARAKGVKLILLDACRDNPLAQRLQLRTSNRSVGPTRGFARVERTQGTLIAYATQANDVATDGEGRNSPFTMALLKEIETPNLEVGTLFRRVTSEVNRLTNGRQTPELSVSILGEFYFRKADTDLQVWTRVRESGTRAEFEDFMARFPASPLVDAARARIAALERSDVDRLSREQSERERLARELADRERLARELADRERLARLRLEQELAERDRLAKLNAEKDDAERARLAREQAERARLAREQAERERLARQKLEQELADRDRLASLRAEPGRLAQPAPPPAPPPVFALPPPAPPPVFALPPPSPAAPRPAPPSTTANLVPPPQLPQTPPALLPSMPRAQLATAVKTELQRLGCYSGALDGGWPTGPATRALGDYQKHAGKPTIDLSERLLDTLKSHKDRVCPLTCGRGQEPRGGVCVAVARPPAPAPARPVATPPAAKPRPVAKPRPAPAPQRREVARPRPPAGGGGRCFNFNGQRFCE